MNIPIIEVFELLRTFDKELLSIIFLSLRVSLSALLIGTFIGLPLAGILSLYRIPFKSFVITSINAFMGIPPVVVGLFLYIVLSRRGVLGFIGALYTSGAMITAQTFIAIPLIIGLGHSAIAGVDASIRHAAISLGANRFQLFLKIISEARYGIVAAIVAAFGRLTAEVGAILIVGGNISGHTRVMTTAIALEADKGNFELACALGVVLMSITLIINCFLHHIQKKGINSESWH